MKDLGLKFLMFGLEGGKRKYQIITLQELNKEQEGKCSSEVSTDKKK